MAPLVRTGGSRHTGLAALPHRNIQIPEQLLKGCSDSVVAFVADDGNHFTDYGIFEGMILFFDTKKSFEKGRLSCYVNEQDNDQPKYKVSDKDMDGYRHYGRLVMMMRSYEV